MAVAARTLGEVGRQQQLVRSWVAEARRTGREDTYAGKRRHPRIEWSASVILEIHPDSPRRRILYVNAKDVSLSGLGLRCRHAIGVNTPVRAFAHDGDEFVSGTVRHSTGTLGGFFVGVEFDHPTGRPGRLAASA